ncbi:hypothetical protein DI005_06025 [Prauserella sp. PE36]|uniref:YggT family protein n=1 Tax=Prauserella endophytica TaxID=1592324 RepID=A0ABY2S8P2_9PSEU|nr:hypothetical protein BAY59_13580 [Prauserella coralliicola]RBM22694.1 hypothetical protein DI005_06025 [Prauserella sp. PE36]TKG72048.1 hypothetical protein FCN18_07160 [Prauserella endophytica]
MARTGIHPRGTTAGRIITGIGSVFALIEVLHILLVVLEANAANGFATFVRSLAEPLALFFPGLFPIDEPRLAVLVNYGLAAVFWLVVTGLLARVLGRTR